mmetsp:Transcript_43177/g.109051  ORF Transcript_43177/g.109051 Transcript_43177/m.109051 type:complete len:441 (+) Transcript_43177:1100-2422(+)
MNRVLLFVFVVFLLVLIFSYLFKNLSFQTTDCLIRGTGNSKRQLRLTTTQCIVHIHLHECGTILPMRTGGTLLKTTLLECCRERFDGETHRIRGGLAGQQLQIEEGDVLQIVVRLPERSHTVVHLTHVELIDRQSGALGDQVGQRAECRTVTHLNSVRAPRAGRWQRCSGDGRLVRLRSGHGTELEHLHILRRALTVPHLLTIRTHVHSVPEQENRTVAQASFGEQRLAVLEPTQHMRGPRAGADQREVCLRREGRAFERELGRQTCQQCGHAFVLLGDHRVLGHRRHVLRILAGVLLLGGGLDRTGGALLVHPEVAGQTHLHTNAVLLALPFGALLAQLGVVLVEQLAQILGQRGQRGPARQRRVLAIADRIGALTATAVLCGDLLDVDLGHTAVVELVPASVLLRFLGLCPILGGLTLALRIGVGRHLGAITTIILRR